ncbi:MAG: glutathione S-transferase family protein [Polyangiaceae bacterium]
MPEPYRLITMGPSHFCEKARWALQRARVPFVEEQHLPLFHAVASYRAGGRRSVPVLVTDSGVLADSTDILELADRQCGGRLYGVGAVRQDAKALEERLDGRFGPDTRRIVYFHILGDSALVLRVFGRGTPVGERVSARLTFPLIRAAMRSSMHITEEATKRSLSRVDEIFSEMSARLEDTGRYLTGEQLTAADITFAALAAPVLLPAQYPVVMPPLSDLPKELTQLVERLRVTRAGRFVLELYETERATVLPPDGS